MKFRKPDITPANAAIGNKKHKGKKIRDGRREDRKLFAKSNSQHHSNGKQIFLQVFLHIDDCDIQEAKDTIYLLAENHYAQNLQQGMAF